MPVREVLLGGDARAPEALSTWSGPGHYLRRRVASVGVLLAIDLAALLAAVACTRTLWGWCGHPLKPPSLALLACLALILVGVLALHGLYGLRDQRSDLWRGVRAALWIVAVALVFLGLDQSWPDGAVATVWAVGLPMAFGGRRLYDACLAAWFGRGVEEKRVVVVGSHEAFERFRAALRRMGFRFQARLLGIVGESTPPRAWQEASGVRSLGLIDNIERIVERERPDVLVVVDGELEAKHLGRLTELCRRRRVLLKLSNVDMRFNGSLIALLPGATPALFVVVSPRGGLGVSWFVKRCLDRVGAALLLVITAPLFALVALAIKLESPGPVFFVDRRVGLGQRVFGCYKFRTMTVDAPQRQAELEAMNEADGAIFKIRNDPRVTRVGRFLRRTSLDELPQLVNVLRGEMSLVGPRPLPLRDNERLEPWHSGRHTVLPGMTGLWQVSGRNDVSFEDMIRLDFHYIESWSLWLDLSILVRTVGAVLAFKGAY